MNKSLKIELNGVSKEDIAVLEEYLKLNHYSYLFDEEEK